MKTALFMIAMAFVAVAQAAPMQNLSFEELRGACRDPKKFQNQLAPTTIVLDCSDRLLKWIPAGEGSFTLPSKRVITHAVSSDKYRVAISGKEVAHEPAVHACPTMKQMEETVALSQEVTCEQILKFEGTATMMCQQLIDDMRSNNPGAVRTIETGKMVSFCSGNKDGGGKKPMNIK